MNPDNISEIMPSDYNTDTYISILDDPIDPIEVENVIKKQIRTSKGHGLDGIFPIFLSTSQQSGFFC